MVKESIEKILARGESETLELKPSLSQVNEIVEAVSAFANAEGGKIIIGVSDSGEIKGVEVGKGTIEKLTNTIAQNTEPKTQPRIVVEKLEGKNIIVVEVNESIDRLVLAFGRPFKRVGKSSPRMSKEEYEKRILEKHKEKLQFDKQICKGATLDDIDKGAIIQFLQKAKIERNLEINLKTPIREVLGKLNLIVENKITNAAILLFGKNPQHFCPQAEVKCARFKGSKPLEFIDMKIFKKNIIEQRNDVIEFVKEHIKLHAEIVGTERVEKWEYPLEAIREAITNAICHRDYKISENIQIRIFDDRLEVWGCGPLPLPLTPEILKKSHKSILRNSLIGKCFFLINYIEEWGTGTNRMIEECWKHGLPEPIFEEVGGDFVVIFRKYRISEEIFESLSERQKRITDYLGEHKEITRNECMELLNLTRDIAIRELLSLKKKGIIKQMGKGKSVYYILA